MGGTGEWKGCEVFVPGRGSGAGLGWGSPHQCCPLVLAPCETPLSQLPYVPHVSPMALLGKVTATTFALERPRCIFDGHADASDAIWLAVAFANASATFRNPQSRADVPPYKQLPTARSYMTLETAAAAYSCSSCSAPSPPVLRVGGDTACRDRGRQDPCNGPLPSPGPYRVKFLLMGCPRPPRRETRGGRDPIHPAPNLFATGLRPLQECGRLVTTGGSHGDAEPEHPHSRPRHRSARTMLPLLLLLLPVAHGIGESIDAIGMDSAFP
uniref:Uroplakin 3B n=1 Tax=Malurus cyaneus samueli TaxID=2593467 RepID=A0A8C5U2Z6_9PASS